MSQFNGHSVSTSAPIDTQPDVRVSQQNKKMAGHPDQLNPKVLLETLIPEGVSPTKKAVIEQLVKLWLSNPKPDPV